MGQHGPHWKSFFFVCLFFIEIQRQGIIQTPMCLCWGKMWKSKVKNIFNIISHVGLKFPWLRNQLNKNISPIRCFDQVFLYSMVFYVNIWKEMASNNTISWSTTYDSILPISAVNTDLPCLHRRFIMFMSARLDDLCPYFCLNLMVAHHKTYLLM